MRMCDSFIHIVSFNMFGEGQRHISYNFAREFDQSNTFLLRILPPKPSKYQKKSDLVTICLNNMTN